MRVRCGQGKAVEQVTVNGGGGQPLGWLLHFWGRLWYGFLLGKLVVTWWLLCTMQTSRDIQGHPGAAHKTFCLMSESSPGQSRGEPEGKHQAPKSKDSRAAWESGREDCILCYRASLVPSSEGIGKRKITL